MSSGLREDAWLAGFTAGEGCFQIVTRNRNRLAPMFSIALRADDIEILEALREAFGGTLCVHAPQGRDNPGVSWQVAKKSQLAELVRYFDRFPLRAKKARDYALWRRAVQAYCAAGSHAPELQPLRIALIDGRKFAADEIDVPEEQCPQLRLVS